MEQESEQTDISRREAMTLGLLLAGGLMSESSKAGGHLSAGPKGPRGPGDPALYQEIFDLLQETENIWNSQQFYRLKEVWDADDPEPWYVPEEIPEPFFSWPPLEKYWNPGRKTLEAFRWEFSNLRVKALADDLALAIFDHFYEFQVAAPGQEPSAGFDRCLTIFRKKPEGWRHILYAQCPYGPESYVRMLRKNMVKPDFGAFRDGLDGNGE